MPKNDQDNMGISQDLSMPILRQNKNPVMI